MKATELRIGNLVLANVGMPSMQVHCITAGDIFDFSIGNLPSDWIKPIPLTEEWLVKLGFSYHELRQSFGITSASGLRLSLIDIGLCHVYIGSYPVTINYVHQLQNLYFALNGTELTIK